MRVECWLTTDVYYERSDDGPGGESEKSDFSFFYSERDNALRPITVGLVSGRRKVVGRLKYVSAETVRSE